MYQQTYNSQRIVLMIWKPKLQERDFRSYQLISTLSFQMTLKFKQMRPEWKTKIQIIRTTNKQDKKEKISQIFQSLQVYFNKVKSKSVVKTEQYKTINKMVEKSWNLWLKIWKGSKTIFIDYNLKVIEIEKSWMKQGQN